MTSSMDPSHYISEVYDPRKLRRWISALGLPLPRTALQALPDTQWSQLLARSADSWQQLPGIGNVLAQRLVTMLQDARLQSLIHFLQQQNIPAQPSVLRPGFLASARGSRESKASAHCRLPCAATHCRPALSQASSPRRWCLPTFPTLLLLLPVLELHFTRPCKPAKIEC